MQYALNNDEAGPTPASPPARRRRRRRPAPSARGTPLAGRAARPRRATPRTCADQSHASDPRHSANGPRSRHMHPIHSLTRHLRDRRRHHMPGLRIDKWIHRPAQTREELHGNAFQQNAGWNYSMRCPGARRKPAALQALRHRRSQSGGGSSAARLACGASAAGSASSASGGSDGRTATCTRRARRQFVRARLVMSPASWATGALLPARPCRRHVLTACTLRNLFSTQVRRPAVPSRGTRGSTARQRHRHPATSPAKGTTGEAEDSDTRMTCELSSRKHLRAIQAGVRGDADAVHVRKRGRVREAARELARHIPQQRAAQRLRARPAARQMSAPAAGSARAGHCQVQHKRQKDLHNLMHTLAMLDPLGQAAQPTSGQKHIYTGIGCGLTLSATAV